MKIWILKAIYQENNSCFWSNPWDKAHGFIVRAATEKEAREMAQAKAGDEKEYGEVWLNPKFTSCKPLKRIGRKGIIMRDFTSA